MTIDDFMRAFAKLAPAVKWVVSERGAPRTPSRNGYQMCPIVAVHEGKNGNRVDNEEVSRLFPMMGLAPKDGLVIAMAAHRDAGFDRGIRDRLLEAVGLPAGT